MCGIVGIAGQKNIIPYIIKSLEKLEYRGYDSSGIATICGENFLEKKSVGKLSKLKKILSNEIVEGNVCIGHTRWATHGIVNEANAHPQISNDVAVVHNGIIENHKVLRKELEEKGHIFVSDTDSEVISQLCSYFLQKENNYEKALLLTLKKLEGAFAFCLMFKKKKNFLFFAKRGSPLVIGYGNEDMFIASDPSALLHVTNNISYLQDYDWGFIKNNQIMIYDNNYKEIVRNKKIIDQKNFNLEKGNFRHYMRKEIFEQPSVFTYSINQFLSLDKNNDYLSFPLKKIYLKKINKIFLIACGTANIACLVGKSWMNSFLDIPIEVDYGSEFRYRNPNIEKNDLCIFVSQSGETADTLASLKYSKKFTNNIISIVNNKESSIARESTFCLSIKAGPEIGVASTKAFTCQLAILFLFCLHISKIKNHINVKEVDLFLDELEKIPSIMVEILNLEKKLIKISKLIYLKKSVLFVGRGLCHPLSLEGALKLKEVSYIHAEGYAAGELKHGPIALVDENIPIIFLIPYDDKVSKIISNLEEVKARGGKIIVIADTRVESYLPEGIWKSFFIPSFKSIFSPFLFSIPVQLIAYHTAVQKGTDVDQPRNLAKSVTVE